jgi:hypothetical protein
MILGTYISDDLKYLEIGNNWLYLISCIIAIRKKNGSRDLAFDFLFFSFFFLMVLGIKPGSHAY